jgi:hypothetical protein
VWLAKLETGSRRVRGQKVRGPLRVADAGGDVESVDIGMRYREESIVALCLSYCCTRKSGLDQR